MQNTQTLVNLIPQSERQAFKEAAQEIRDRFHDKHAFWLALADLFESQYGVQECPIPEVGKQLEREIFEQYLLGAVEEG